MRKLFAIFIFINALLLGISGSATLLLKNNTGTTIEVYLPTADKKLITRVRDLKITEYFEIEPNEYDLLLTGLNLPVSIRLITGKNWSNLDSLGNPPFSQQIANEKKNNPDKIPVVVIGTKYLGFSWDIKIEWMSEEEVSKKIIKGTHYLKKNLNQR